MAMFVGGIVALLVGVLALGWGGATRHRRRGKRISLLALGAVTTAAGVVLIYRAVSFEAFAMIASGLTVLIGAGVVLWYFVGLVASVDESLTRREPPPPTDFEFLNQPGEMQTPVTPKRPSLTKRMGLQTAGERIAKMGWMFRKPPQ